MPTWFHPDGSVASDSWETRAEAARTGFNCARVNRPAPTRRLRLILNCREGHHDNTELAVDGCKRVRLAEGGRNRIYKHMNERPRSNGARHESETSFDCSRSIIIINWFSPRELASERREQKVLHWGSADKPARGRAQRGPIPIRKELNSFLQSLFLRRISPTLSSLFLLITFYL